MLYVAEKTLIEATNSQKNEYSRLWSASERLGAEIETIKNEDVVDGRAIYFCTYLK